MLREEALDERLHRIVRKCMGALIGGTPNAEWIEAEFLLEEREKRELLQPVRVEVDQTLLCHPCESPCDVGETLRVKLFHTALLRRRQQQE